MATSLFKVDYSFLDSVVLTTKSSDIPNFINIRSRQDLIDNFTNQYVLPALGFKFDSFFHEQLKKGKGKDLEKIILKVLDKKELSGDDVISKKERSKLKQDPSYKKYFEDGFTKIGKGYYKNFSSISEREFDKTIEQVKSISSGVNSSLVQFYIGKLEDLYFTKEGKGQRIVKLVIEDVPLLVGKENRDLNLWVILGRLEKDRSRSTNKNIQYSYDELKSYLQDPEKFELVISPDDNTERKIVESFIEYAKRQNKDFKVTPPGTISKGGAKYKGVLDQNLRSENTPHKLSQTRSETDGKGKIEPLAYMNLLIKDNKPLSGRGNAGEVPPVLDIRQFEVTDKQKSYDDQIKTIEKDFKNGIGSRLEAGGKIDAIQRKKENYYFTKDFVDLLLDPNEKSAEELRTSLYSNGRQLLKRQPNKSGQVGQSTGFRFEHIVPMNFLISLGNLIIKLKPEDYADSLILMLDKLYKVAWVPMYVDKFLDVSNKDSVPTSLSKAIGVTTNPKGKTNNKLTLSSGVDGDQLIKNLKNLDDKTQLLRYQRISVDVVSFDKVFTSGLELILDNYTTEELQLKTKAIPESIKLSELINLS